jgi:hypothetical protein
MPKAKYSDIKAEPSDGPASPDTEAGVPLMDEERAESWNSRLDEIDLRAPRRKARGLRRGLDAFRPYWWMVDTGLLLVILFLLLGRKVPDSILGVGSPSQDIGGDVTGFYPQCKPPSGFIGVNTVEANVHPLQSAKSSRLSSSTRTSSPTTQRSSSDTTPRRIGWIWSQVRDCHANDRPASS